MPSPPESCTRHKPIAMRIEPERLGVDRNPSRERHTRRQITLMQLDLRCRHCSSPVGKRVVQNKLPDAVRCVGSLFVSSQCWPRRLMTHLRSQGTRPSRIFATDKECRVIATASEDKTARVFHGDGHLLSVLRPPIGPGNGGKLRAVAVSPDGRLVAVGGWAICGFAKSRVAIAQLGREFAQR